MVKYTSIIQAISHYTKCHPTIAEMTQELKQYDYNEQHRMLSKQDLFFNVDEAIEHRDLYFEYYRLSEMLKNDNGNKELQEALEETEKELFYYGRRLIEGVPDTQEPPTVDRENFTIDKQLINRDGPTVYNSMGEMEEAQINEQSKKLRKKTDNHIESPIDEGEYITIFEDSNDERFSMNDYFAGDTNHINGDIYNKKYLNKLNDEQRRNIKDIDKIMKKSPGLLQDTVLYRGGKLDIHLREGDHSVFKTYTSTSFQEYTANEYRNTGDMLIKIYAPKGTKGVCGNDKWNFKNGFMEHEYTLPRNTGYTVLSIDYENNIAEILLD